jgi:hypothetical protein
MPNPTVVPIAQPRVPFLNPQTGFVSREWYMFLLSLNQLTSGSDISLGDVQKGPPQLTIDEINALVDKAVDNINPSQDGLLEQIAELQKQVDALQLTPILAFGTMASQNTGVSGTVVLAKITGLGADGSLTFANGIITAYVAPT